MKAELPLVEAALAAWVPLESPAQLGDAMRYAVLDGGKRLRPLLALAAARSAGTCDEGAAMRAACSVELIHAYSLVHDDLPCMDNDVLRRGKPTVHVQFGQAQALLAGDALQALAFELLVPGDDVMPPSLSARLCRLLAHAAGVQGMAGGQAIDLACVGQAITREQLAHMHRLKTGALLQASVLMGAACGGVTGTAWQALEQYGNHLGLAFQVVDDILDVVGDAATLGKTAGKDALNDKPTYVALLGLEGAQSFANQTLAAAHAALESTQLPHTQPLHELADLVGGRNH
jgi:farnesyl diphosphate synthase